MADYPDTPITRDEQYLANALGGDVQMPTPITREEKYLYNIAVNINGGGSPVNVQDDKSVTITSNQNATVEPDDGYDAVEEVVVTAAVPSVTTMVLIDTYTSASTSVSSTVWGIAGRDISGTGALVAVDDQNVKHPMIARSGAAADYTLTFSGDITFAYVSSPASVTITGATSLTMYRTTFSYPS